MAYNLVLDCATGSTPHMTYRPPRLGDLLHARLGDCPEHAAMIEIVGDDGQTLVLSGPVGRQDLVVTIRRVGAETTGAPS